MNRLMSLFGTRVDHTKPPPWLRQTASNTAPPLDGPSPSTLAVPTPWIAQPDRQSSVFVFWFFRVSSSSIFLESVCSLLKEGSLYKQGCSVPRLPRTFHLCSPRHAALEVRSLSVSPIAGSRTLTTIPVEHFSGLGSTKSRVDSCVTANEDPSPRIREGTNQTCSLALQFLSLAFPSAFLVKVLEVDAAQLTKSKEYYCRRATAEEQKMGCTSSKHLRRQAMRENWSALLPRSVSMPVYHRPEREGDSYHMVALTSSSYGILKFDNSSQNSGSFIGLCRKADEADDISSECARQWIANLKMKPVKEEDERKICKDSELETVNTWELMEGLEDDLSPSPLQRPAMAESRMLRSLDRSVSFHTVQEVDAHYSRMGSPANSRWHKYHNLGGKENVKPENGSSQATLCIKKKFMSGSPSSMDNNIPLSPSRKQSPNMQNSHTNVRFDGVIEQFSGGPLKNGILYDNCRESNSPLFDPTLLATFKKALDSSSEDDWHTTTECTNSSCSSLENAPSSLDSSSDADSPQLEFEEKVDKSHGNKLSSSKISPLDYEEDWKARELLVSFELKCPPEGEGKVVLYFTSLRGIRKTYEDCCEMRLILQGTRVYVDERDVWMHSKFKQELTDLFGKPTTVPRLFIKGRYIGGAQEVKQLHEEGILAKLLHGLPIEDSRQVCDGCGDLRFVPCLTCSGSCKVINDDNVVSRCADCNENGLIMCPLCS